MRFPQFKTTQVGNKNKCFTCGERMPAASGNGAPAEGDLSICILCEGVAIFNADLTIRRPTPAELIELSFDPGLKASLRILRQAKARVRRKVGQN